jgi:hypothetical protein
MAAITEEPSRPETHRLEDYYEDKPEGPISAAIIAGGIGALALGILTTLAEANESIKDFLDLKTSVGPLSGKTAFAVLIWLVAWGVLHAAMRGTRYETRRAFAIAMILVALGVLGTFPTFFQAFVSE